MTAARAALDMGDRARALASVNAALALDPEYLAAQALRERIERSPTIPLHTPPRAAAGTGPAPVPASRAARPTPSAPEPPVVSPEGWARFEQRARSRRIDRRIASARVAISRHRFGEARSILREISEIDDSHPDLISLGIELDAEEHLARTRPRRWGPAVAAVLIFAAVVSGARLLRMPQELRPAVSPVLPIADAPVATEFAQQTTPPVPEQLAAPTPGENPPAPESAPAPEENVSTTLGNGIHLSQPAVTIPAPTPPSTTDSAAPSQSVPTAASPTAQAVEVRTVPFERSAVPSATTGRLDEIPRGAPDFAPPLPAPAPPPLAPAVTPAAMPGNVVPEPPAPEVRVAPRDEPATTRPAASVLNAAVSAPRDEDLVRRTLQQYRLAYESLDARSAQAVWPRVDEAALQRAFAGLESQRLTFDDCQMDLRGPTGVATCRGTTLYVPKVGNREPHRESRIWTFDLRKVGDTWQIDSARAAR